MGAFAQAARRQNNARDFGVNLEQIGQIITNNMLKQQAIDRETRRKKQSVDFNNFNINAGDDLKALYTKSIADQEISPEESASIAGKVFDFNQGMNQFDTLDPKLKASSTSAFSDLANNFGTVTEKKEIPIQYTKDFLDEKQNRAISLADHKDKIHDENKAADHKNNLALVDYKDKIHDGNRDGKSDIPKSNVANDYANVQSGIAELSKFWDAPRVNNPDDPEGEYFDIQGSRTYLSKEQALQYKETKKNQYQESALQMVNKYKTDTGIDMDKIIERLRSDVQGSSENLDVALNTLQKYNPDLPEDAIKILRAYFQINLQ